MVKTENHIGSIIISENYIRQLVEYNVKNCYGVVGICSANPLEMLISKIYPNIRKGIIIYFNNNSVIIEIHITAAFGTNIGVVVKSVVHKVRFAISEALGDINCKVNVFVDDIN